MLFAIPVLIGLGARWSARAAIAELEQSNVALQMENASYREATGALAAQISSLQAAVDALGVQAAVDPAARRAMDKLPAIVKSRAMGGESAASLAGPVLGGAFGAPDDTFSVLRDLLGALESSLDIVRNGVERRHALAAATPSIWPVTGWLSSSYGIRRDPFTGERGFPSRARHLRRLRRSRSTRRPMASSPAPARAANYGNLVVVEHGYGITTRYGHLSRFAAVSGQQVHRGDIVGYVGSTGRSTSAHLHYEILLNGQLTNPLKLLTGRIDATPHASD